MGKIFTCWTLWIKGWCCIVAAGESTYEPIQTFNVTTNTQTVEFSSIPSTYTDLVLLFYGEGYAATSGGTVDSMVMRFNGSTSAIYGSWNIDAKGDSSRYAFKENSGTSITFPIAAASTATHNPSLARIDIQSYSNSNAWKTCIGRYALETGGNTSMGVRQVFGTVGGQWRSTTSITSIQLSTSAGSATGFVSGRFTLYGIKAG